MRARDFRFPRADSAAAISTCSRDAAVCNRSVTNRALTARDVVGWHAKARCARSLERERHRVGSADRSDRRHHYGPSTIPTPPSTNARPPRRWPAAGRRIQAVRMGSRTLRNRQDQATALARRQTFSDRDRRSRHDAIVPRHRPRTDARHDAIKRDRPFPAATPAAFHVLLALADGGWPDTQGRRRAHRRRVRLNTGTLYGLIKRSSMTN
jgi:hypothetical protein